MIEHPLPTPATAKLLYAHAIRCAYVGCEEPLYREDDQSGAWLLNSRICHICARSEGGPRWDTKQSSEESRSENNLLLMCPAHASAIDDPRAVDAFPTALLQDWKAAQLKEHLEARRGWPLTSSMARQALSASFSQVAVAIHNSTVDLAGRGGNALGAGGGGGGAIGPGARGGRGGEGGSFDVRGGGLSAHAYSAQTIKKDDGLAPGSGGGGAGAYGPNSVAGDGGDGGNSVIEQFPVEPGDLLEIEVGKGSAATALPGSHGVPAGDTVIIHKSSDGTLERITRATGARGVQSGRFPDDWAAISKEDIDGGFCISTLMPVNAAENQSGLIYILGGGWSSFTLPTLPCEAVWNIICVANWATLQPSSARGVQLYLADPSHTEVSCSALPLAKEIFMGRSCIWFCQLGATFDQVGCWHLGVKSGEFLLSEIQISVGVHQQPWQQT